MSTFNARLRSARTGLPRTRVAAALRRGRERGMTTAEYAVGTVAACGMAGVLYRLVESDTIMGFLTGLVEKAFGLLG